MMDEMLGYFVRRLVYQRARRVMKVRSVMLGVVLGFSLVVVLGLLLNALGMGDWS